MIPHNSPLYCTIQNRPNAGILRVVGWNTVTGQPYLVHLKTKEWQRPKYSVGATEWDPSNPGILVFHDSRKDADAELDRMLKEVYSVWDEAEKIIRTAAK